MSKTDRTPGELSFGVNSCGDVYIMMGDTEIAYMNDPIDWPDDPHKPEILANAGFIVTACNRHDDLVEALGGIHRLGLMILARLDLEQKESGSDEYICAAYHDELRNRLDKVWQVITKAKGE